MKKRVPLPLILLWTTTAQAAPVTLFQSNFDSAVNTGNQIVDGSYSLEQTAGSVNISPYGTFSGNALLFNQQSGQTGESVSLDHGGGFSSYSIQFDLYTQGLMGSGHSFRIQLGSSPEQSIKFGNCCQNTAYIFTGNSTPLGAFLDNTLFNVSIDLNLNAQTLSASIDGIGSQSVSLGNDPIDWSVFSFSLSPASGITPPDENIYVGLDNLTITATAVPIPATAWLFLSAMGVLFSTNRITQG